MSKERIWKEPEIKKASAGRTGEANKLLNFVFIMDDTEIRLKSPIPQRYVKEIIMPL